MTDRKKSAIEICRARLANDEGAAGLIIAMIIVMVSFTALSVLLKQTTGPQRQLRHFEETSRNAKLILNALEVHFLAGSPGLLPCPDTTLDGEADDCSGTGTAAGTVPWRDLGLSPSDVVDGYGQYYTYVVPASAAARAVCETVAGEYTGEMLAMTDLETRTATQSEGEGTFVPFVLVSHGINGLGGTTASGQPRAAPAAGSDEETNASDSPGSIVSGPFSASFDDAVSAPSTAKYEDICEQLTPGGALNADVDEDFSSGPGFDSAVFTTMGSADPPSAVNGAAQFGSADSYLATADGVETSPEIKALYVSALWTPGASTAGFSIATRATLAPTGDVFATGLTFRFDNRTGTTASTGGGTANAISIRDQSGSLGGASGDSGYNIIIGERYKLEVYDNAEEIWMRVTQVSDPANTASLRATNTTDLTGDQRVGFVNGNGAGTLDDVIVGVPMLALDTYGAGYAETQNPDNGTTTGSITLEAWVRPRSLSGTDVIMAQWDTNTSADEDNSFRLYALDGALKLGLNDAGGTNDNEVFDLGITLTADTWTHVAVSYDQSGAGTFTAYHNGAAVSTFSGFAGDSINVAEHPFMVGADLANGAAADYFDGAISDVRVWDDVRSAAEIADWYKRRLPLADGALVDNLVVNWRFDRESGGLYADEALAAPAIGEEGDFAGAAVYIGALLNESRPTAADICSGNEAGAYRCEFRDAGFSTVIPADRLAGLGSLYVKAWGGGGGAYLSGATVTHTGGGGGFAGGHLLNTGEALTITVGAGGAAGSAGDDGDDTVLRRGTDVLITARGGNRASNGNDGNGGNTQTDSELLNASTADGNSPAPGCVPAGDPCADPYYNPESGTENPGRGGEANDANGHNGAVVLLW